MRDDLLEHVAHLEVVRVALVVVDVAAGQGRLIEMPDQHLLLERQLLEAVRIELHDRRVVHALEQVLAIRRRGRRRRRLRAVGRRRVAVSFPTASSLTRPSLLLSCLPDTRCHARTCSQCSPVLDLRTCGPDCQPCRRQRFRRAHVSRARHLRVQPSLALIDACSASIARARRGR